MTDCTRPDIPFPSCKRRKIDTAFDGGHVTGDAGVLLLRQVERRIRLISQVARAIGDPRRVNSCTHPFESVLRQRIFAIAQGYEDLNDHQTLRNDPVMQTAVERDEQLASPSVLCRLENRTDKRWFWAVQYILIDQFIAAHKRVPKEVILDFDATDDPVHGRQEHRYFHGYYDHYCFLPLYVFSGQHLLSAYLRPSNIDGAKHAGAMLAVITRRLRKVWPRVRIVFRGDSGFCRDRVLRWCERNRVHYVVGIARNNRLEQEAAPQMQRAKERYEKTKQAQRIFSNFYYAAGTWENERRVIAKSEYLPKGPNPRFIVTNMRLASDRLYEKLYCARGDMENRIKEQQLDLFADRTSCHSWWPNQWRLLLASLAYVLLSELRRVGLRSTHMARAQCGTIRLKLLKIGAVVIRNTRRVRLLMSSAYPEQPLFWLVAKRLAPD